LAFDPTASPEKFVRSVSANSMRSSINSASDSSSFIEAQLLFKFCSVVQSNVQFPRLWLARFDAETVIHFVCLELQDAIQLPIPHVKSAIK
jgi:hypothetical protein